jgi:hypothetical protein
MTARPNKRGARVGPRTPPVKWLSQPIVLGRRARIVGVCDDVVDADAVFAELEREGQHEGRAA